MRAQLAGLAIWNGTGAAGAATYPLPPPGESLVGELGSYVTVEEDTLVDVARRTRLGYEELTLANPAVDRWLPGEGTSVVLPTRYILPRGPREGIVVNIAEYRLYWFPPARRGEPRVVETYAISAGRAEWQTPNGIATYISRKLENPAWYPPLSIRKEHAAEGHKLPAIVPPGPDNPLGPLALKLGIPGGYFIHGTSKPFGIGMSVTHGCLRLYPEDIEALFKAVPEGTRVRIVDEPYKTAWKDGVLYVEAHPAPDDNGIPRVDRAGLEGAIQRALRKNPAYAVDPAWLESLALRPRGIPLPVLRAQPERA
jgi:L,D-transpeptidase ErfK/SrfK